MTQLYASLYYTNPVFDYFVLCDQALQAPACHENMIKVGGYILGEFGNLIAGDPRSRYAIISRSDCWCMFYHYTYKLSKYLHEI